MQRSPLHNEEEEALNTSTTTKQLAMLRIHSPPIPFTTTTNDSDNRVIFADPCSMCGTKKRQMSLSPLHNHHHHHQDYSFTPRKKLFFFSEPSSNNNNNDKNTSPSSSTQTPIPLFQPQKQNPTPVLCRSNSDPLPSFENKKSNSPQSPPPPSANLGYSGSFAGSSGASPATASRPPRVPALIRSISDPIPRSSSGKKNVGDDVVGAPVSCLDSERKTGGESESPAEMRWKRMRACLAEMNNWWKEEIKIEDTNNDTKNKEVCEISTEGNVEREKDGDSCLVRASGKCSCGKSIQLVVTIVPE